jgi:Zn-finger nucleic acid-binding protein
VRYVLIPNQHIGAWEVGFMPQWITREYLARRGGARFGAGRLKPPAARCSATPRAPSSSRGAPSAPGSSRSTNSPRSAPPPTTCKGTWLPGRALRRVLRPEALQSLLGKGNSGVVSALDCADCGRKLDVVFVNGCEIDLCPACHGLWLDFREVERISSRFQPGSAVVADERERAKTHRSAGAAAGDVGTCVWGVADILGWLALLVLD